MPETLDPRTPVIVGTGQVTHRKSDEGEATALSMMAEATRRAAEDAGGDLLPKVQLVGAVETFSWPVLDPGKRLADELGLAPRETTVSARGGTSPVEQLGDIAGLIQQGDLDVALLVGGEAFSDLKRHQAAGTWGEVGDNPPAARTVGKDADPSHAAELAAGLLVPVVYYPLFEHAFRGLQGRSTDEHMRSVAEWWAPYSQVAADNPYAWSQQPMDPSEVLTPTPQNRLITSPYPKSMNANISVDQGAALLITSVQAAQDAGIPRDRWVFVHATGHAHDHWFAGEHEHLGRSPAIAANGKAALTHAGLDIDDIAHVDLYSCFPSAVQIAANELGFTLGNGRTPTVTGGLSFFGGPANNYVTHSLAELVARLREDGEGHGLATAVGWYLTKHATAILGAKPPARPFSAQRPQAEVDALPKVAIEEDYTGEAAIESFTATFDHDGTATMAIVAVRTPSGGRTFAAAHDPQIAGDLLQQEALGRTVQVQGAAFTL